MTLLEKAKKVDKGSGAGSITKEQIDLALAWVKGEITNKQATKVLPGTSRANLYIYMARALREAFTRGILK